MNLLFFICFLSNEFIICGQLKEKNSFCLLGSSGNCACYNIIFVKEVSFGQNLNEKQMNNNYY